MQSKTQELFVMIGIMAALVFVGVSLVINSYKSCDVSIDYDATVDGLTNETYANLAEVKLACYRLCITELYNDNSMQSKCLDKCEKL